MASFYGIIDKPDRVKKNAPDAGRLPRRRGASSWDGSAGWRSASSSTCTAAEAGWPINYPVVNFGIVIAGLVVIVLGLWDDIQGIRPVVKICGQVIAAACLLLDDVGTQCTRPMLAPLDPPMSPSSATGQSPCRAGQRPPSGSISVVLVTSGLLVVLVIVGCCNATNLMDGWTAFAAG